MFSRCAFGTAPWSRCPHARRQVADVEAAKAEAVKLLVRASQLQRIVTGAAAGYRRFFSWLLRNIQRLGDGADGGRLGVEEGAGPTDAPAVAHFVTGQLMVDVLGRELQASHSLP